MASLNVDSGVFTNLPGGAPKGGKVEAIRLSGSSPWRVLLLCVDCVLPEAESPLRSLICHCEASRGTSNSLRTEELIVE